MTQRAHNSIRTWALVAVFVTSAALIYFGWWLIGLLSEPTWCNRAIGAVERAEGRAESAVQGCFGLLRQQVDALAFNSHLAIGTLALCLLALVVIVLAGGRLSFTAGKGGIAGNMSAKDDPVADAALATADAARDQAKEIVEQRGGTVDEPEGGA